MSKVEFFSSLFSRAASAAEPVGLYRLLKKGDANSGFKRIETD